MAALARSHLETINANLVPVCCCFKVVSKGGLRTVAEQNEIPSANTGARGLTSYHIWGLAYDITLFRGPIPRADESFDCAKATTIVWESQEYLDAGPFGEALGLEWGRRFKRDDRPHYQYPLRNFRISSIHELIDLYQTYQKVFKISILPNEYIKIRALIPNAPPNPFPPPIPPPPQQSQGSQ